MVDETNNEYTGKLISLIKARPALYDRTLLGYNNRSLKQKLWFEICEVMTPGWIHHNLSEKIQIGVKVQKRWQEIKSSYEKELNQKKLIRLLGAHASRHKKFVYLDKLDFLKPTMNLRPSPSSSVQGRHVRLTTVNNSPSYVPATTNYHRSGHVQKNKHKKQPNKEPYLRIVNVESTKVIDEDKHFLLSLVPSLQKMSSTQKMRAKMMFLKAIHDIEEEIQQTLPSTQFDGNECNGYNQSRQFPSPLTFTITSDNINDQSNLPTVIPTQPNVIQNPRSLLQNPPSIQRPVQQSPRLIQNSPNQTPQKTNDSQLSRVWIKDNSLLLAQQSLNVIKDEIIIDDD